MQYMPWPTAKQLERVDELLHELELNDVPVPLQLADWESPIRTVRANRSHEQWRFHLTWKWR